jgi:hypothetical protein
MKSYKPWAATLPLLLATAVACGGESSIGRGNETPTDAGGTKATGSSGGAGSITGSSAGKPSGSGGRASGSGGKSSGAGGASEGGVTGSGAASQGGMDGGTPTPGSVPPDGMCSKDSDCLARPCETCADGTVLCSKTFCTGQCHTDLMYCPVACTDDKDCVKDDEWSCHDCDDGTRHCPVGSCSAGYCNFEYTGCIVKDPCAGLACGEACDACAANSNCDVSLPTHCAPDGSCSAGKFTCPAECQTSEDCPAFEECKQPCPATGKCPLNACLQGSCEPVCPLE